jgi:hypothetical protein
MQPEPSNGLAVSAGLILQLHPYECQEFLLLELGLKLPQQ